MLLKDYHVKLAPLVALSLQCKRDDYYRKATTRAMKSKSRNKAAAFTDFEDENFGLTYTEALDIIRKNNEAIAAQRELES